MSVILSRLREALIVSQEAVKSDKENDPFSAIPRYAESVSILESITPKSVCFNFKRNLILNFEKVI